MVRKVSNCAKAYLSAVGGKENVFVDKETINCLFNILLEVDELLRNLDKTLHHMLAVPPHSVPLHFET